MTVVLHALSYLAVIVGFVFGLLSLANGLLYIAEVIEEHAQLAKTVGQRLVFVEIVLLALLYAVDGLPLYLVAVGILAHVVYLQNFSRQWPVISIKSITFVASCALVLLSHFLSFRYFSDRSASVYPHHGRHAGRQGWYANTASHEDSFLDVATYFAVCVWLVPFYLFLSLSANDNVLPSSGETPTPSQPSSPSIAPKATFLAAPARAPDSPTLGRHSRQRSSMMKTALSSVFAVMPPTLRPAHLSTHLPLPQGRSGTSMSPRQDLPHSPDPTYVFQSVPNSTGSSPLPTPGQPEDHSAATSAFSAAVASSNLSSGSTFSRGNRPVPLRSVTTAPAIQTENLASASHPAPPHSAGVFASSPMSSSFAPPTTGRNGVPAANGGPPLHSPSSMSALARSQPTSPVKSRFPATTPLSVSVGPSASSTAAPSPRLVSPQMGGTSMSPSLSAQGFNHHSGLGVALARRNTVDAGAPQQQQPPPPPGVVRRGSAFGEGMQQRRPPGGADSSSAGSRPGGRPPPPAF
ncbi:hypothetical protein JCM8202_003692 [Rhodotorula sphaerocarpa]